GDQMAYPGIVGTNPMHEEKNDLVEPESDEQGELCGHTGMSDIKPLTPAPPLQHNEQHKERNAKLACRYHERVQQDVGHTGTGFSDEMLEDILKRLTPYFTDSCP